MKYKLISCDVFMRMASLVAALSPYTIDLEFTPLDSHDDSQKLNEIIQKKIDAVKEEQYDAILLGYGLCGNSTNNITARNIPLIIPRAHDCCTLFLGSKEKFVECFGDNLSAQWSCAEYMERGSDYLHDSDTGKMMGLDKALEELVVQYGVETAQYVWETLHPVDHSDTLIYIEVPEFEHLGFKEKLQKRAQEENKSVKTLEGSMRLITGLLAGEWDEKKYLIVPPGKSTKAVYDHDEIISIDD
ncbi:MAG: DUF1638 domain-containing protein [Clostridiales bacterium]|nr:DUF1638 domain-containing protein [Clostridiales bacterium]